MNVIRLPSADELGLPVDELGRYEATLCQEDKLPSVRARMPEGGSHMPSELPLEQIVAAIDTREQLPLSLSPMKAVRRTLTTGDYSVCGLEKYVTVERKGLSDFINCVGRDRKRFEECVHRMLAYPCRVIVIESTWDELKRGGWKQVVSAEAACNSVLGWMAIGIPVLMAGNHHESGKVVREILVMAARRRWRECRKLIATAQAMAKTEGRLF